MDYMNEKNLKKYLTRLQKLGPRNETFKNAIEHTSKSLYMLRMNYKKYTKLEYEIMQEAKKPIPNVIRLRKLNTQLRSKLDDAFICMNTINQRSADYKVEPIFQVTKGSASRSTKTDEMEKNVENYLKHLEERVNNQYIFSDEKKKTISYDKTYVQSFLETEQIQSHERNTPSDSTTEKTSKKIVPETYKEKKEPRQQIKKWNSIEEIYTTIGIQEKSGFTTPNTQDGPGDHDNR